MNKLDRDALLADQETVRGLLADLPPGDVVGKISLESRLAEIEEELVDIDREIGTAATVALMFGGEPVVGSRSIDADFSAKALHWFYSLVRKKVAVDEFGSLGGRGPIPRRTADVDLSITQLVRGSMGFLLEETSRQREVTDTVVKQALDQITDLVINTASDNANDFEEAVETLDPRLLVSLKRFFRTLDDRHATLHIVERERDATLDSSAVQRGRRRIDATQIEDSESETIVGELLGLLPDGRRFEMKLRGTGEIIKGSVAAPYVEQYLALIETPTQGPVGRVWRAKMRIREIRERNKPPRRRYYLLGLLEQVRQ